MHWIQPEIPLAHHSTTAGSLPLSRCGFLLRIRLGQDKRNYCKLMKPLVRDWEKLSAEFLQAMLHLPRHPIALAKFGMRALCHHIARQLFFKSNPARALFAGVAAHSFLPLESPLSSAFGFVLGSAGHAVGWPIPSRGSQTISNALAAYLQELGGKSKLTVRSTISSSLRRRGPFCSTPQCGISSGSLEIIAGPIQAAAAEVFDTRLEFSNRLRAFGCNSMAIG